MVAGGVSHFIGGRHVRSALLKTFGADDPATGTEYAQVAVGVAADVNQAVLAAQAALESGPWADMMPAERAAVLNRIADAIDARVKGECQASQLIELDVMNPVPYPLPTVQSMPSQEPGTAVPVPT